MPTDNSNHSKIDSRLATLKSFAEQAKAIAEKEEPDLSEEEKAKVASIADGALDALLKPSIVAKLSQVLGQHVELLLLAYQAKLLDAKHVKIILTIAIGSEIALETLKKVTTQLMWLKGQGLLMKLAPNLIQGMFKGMALPI